ncbi:MAG TPA: hypothetical protein VGH03_22500 [Caulobacteraceae bacterium]
MIGQLSVFSVQGNITSDEPIRLDDARRVFKEALQVGGANLVTETDKAIEFRRQKPIFNNWSIFLFVNHGMFSLTETEEKVHVKFFLSIAALYSILIMIFILICVVVFAAPHLNSGKNPEVLLPKFSAGLLCFGVVNYALLRIRIPLWIRGILAKAMDSPEMPGQR